MTNSRVTGIEEENGSLNACLGNLGHLRSRFQDHPIRPETGDSPIWRTTFPNQEKLTRCKAEGRQENGAQGDDLQSRRSTLGKVSQNLPRAAGSHAKVLIHSSFRLALLDGADMRRQALQSIPRSFPARSKMDWNILILLSFSFHPFRSKLVLVTIEFDSCIEFKAFLHVSSSIISIQEAHSP
jgi:hypothetical protein